jgi:hypothetical protein
MIETKNILLEKIIISESKYFSIRRKLWDVQKSKYNILESSLCDVGQVGALIVQEYSKGKFQLVDGFLRAAWGLKNKQKEVLCVVLGKETGPEKIIDILLLEHYDRILFSVTARVQFLRYAEGLGVSDDLLIQKYLPALQFEGHKNILDRCKSVADLPEKVLEFCSEKQFALKQCFSLTQYDFDLLMTVFSWRGELSLTASIIEELLENLNDYLRAASLTVSQFVDDLEFLGVMSLDLPAGEKTQRVRNFIRQKRYPVLSEVNSKMDEIAKNMKLSSNINISWDRTLENKGLTVSVRVQGADDFENGVKTLGKDEIKKLMKELLDSL